MAGAEPFIFAANIAIPDARQCLVIAGPILGVIAAWWIISHIDQWISKLFPQWEWEKKLGWLNIQSARRADDIFRWLGYGVYALLAASLYGIVWSASAFADVNETLDPSSVANGMWKFSTLLMCMGLWVLYLGWELYPKLKREYEWEELQRYRAEQAEIEAEIEAQLGRNPASRHPATTLEIWSKTPPSLPRGSRPRR